MNEFLNKRWGYVWYQDEISLAEHRLVGPLKFVTTGRNKLKYHDIIDDKQWKELDKEGQNKVINTSDTR